MLDGRLREEQAGLRERHQAAQRRSELLLSKLAAAVSAVSSTAVPGPVLGSAGGAGPSLAELECPVCLEEMRPPTRIWQAGSRPHSAGSL